MQRDDDARRTGKKLSAERGRCIACVRYQPNAKYVDLGGELPRIGKMYICSSCIDRCRQVLGYASQASHEQTLEKLAECEARVEELTAENSKLQNQVDSALQDVLSEALLRARDIQQAG